MAPHEVSLLGALVPRESMIDKPDNTQIRQYRTLIVILSVVPPIVVLRFVSRYLHRMPFGWDDGTLICGCGCVLLYVASAFGFQALQYGMGVHAHYLTDYQVMMALKSLYILEVFYIGALVLVKWSVLLMYRRIFPIRSVQIGSIILGGAVMAWLVSALLVAVLQCNPPAKMWDDTIPGFCLDPLAVLVGPGVPNILTDIFILALPVKPILDLHVSFGRKMLIVFTFLTGFFVVGVSVYHLVVQSQFVASDMTYTIVDPMAWCLVETGAGAISSCLPTLMPVINLALSQFAWGRRWLKYDKSTGASKSESRRTKQATADSTDDHEHPLTTSSHTQLDMSPDNYATWQIHQLKGDHLDDGESERYINVDISKSPKAQEAVNSGSSDVEMDGLGGIRVMQKVEIIDNHAWR